MVVRVKRCGSICDREDATIRKKDAGDTHRKWRVEISAAPDRPDRPSPCTLSSNFTRMCHQLIWIGRERVLEVTKRLPGPSIQSVQASKQPDNHCTQTTIDGRSRPGQNTCPQPKTSADRFNVSREAPSASSRKHYTAVHRTAAPEWHIQRADAFLQTPIPARESAAALKP